MIEAALVFASIAAWLDANAVPVNAYLIRSQWIPMGRTWRDLASDKTDLIVTRTAQFARAAGIGMPK